MPARDERLLAGKLAGLFDLRRQQWRAVRFVPAPRQNEKVLARDLVAGLPAGSLVLADLGYFGFAWFDWLQDQGQHYISRLRGKTSYTVRHVFYQQGDVFDGVVWLGAHRADRAGHAVRLVSLRVGTSTYRYITDVLDPTVLSVAEIARLYARRWDIELAFTLVKRHLKLHLLWSAKPVVIQQQLWAVLIIAQILQALRLEIAGRAGVDPYEVSMALLVQYLAEVAREGRTPSPCSWNGPAGALHSPSTHGDAGADDSPRADRAATGRDVLAAHAAPCAEGVAGSTTNMLESMNGVRPLQRRETPRVSGGVGRARRCAPPSHRADGRQAGRAERRSAPTTSRHRASWAV